MEKKKNKYKYEYGHGHEYMYMNMYMYKPAIRGILTGLMILTMILAFHGPVALAQEKLTVSGLTEPINDVILSSDVGGRIDKIFYKEGDHVSKNRRILALEKRFEELEVKRRKLIWESKVEVNIAADRAATLKSLLASTRELFETMGSVSKEELEEKELEYKLAVAEHERLQIAEEQEKIEYEMAVEKVEKLILKSPINGSVTELFLDAGENCEAREPMIHLVDTSRCLLICNIEAPLGERFSKGQEVDLVIPVGTESVQKKGEIIFVSPVVDPASGLLTVKAEFENADGSVRPGVAGTMVIPSP